MHSLISYSIQGQATPTRVSSGSARCKICASRASGGFPDSHGQYLIRRLGRRLLLRRACVRNCHRALKKELCPRAPTLYADPRIDMDHGPWRQRIEHVYFPHACISIPFVWQRSPPSVTSIHYGVCPVHWYRVHTWSPRRNSPWRAVRVRAPIIPYILCFGNLGCRLQRDPNTGPGRRCQEKISMISHDSRCNIQH